jgi:hypothetical protein
MLPTSPSGLRYLCRNTQQSADARLSQGEGKLPWWSNRARCSNESHPPRSRKWGHNRVARRKWYWLWISQGEQQRDCASPCCPHERGRICSLELIPRFLRLSALVAIELGNEALLEGGLDDDTQTGNHSTTADDMSVREYGSPRQDKQPQRVYDDALPPLY